MVVNVHGRVAPMHGLRCPAEGQGSSWANVCPTLAHCKGSLIFPLWICFIALSLIARGVNCSFGVFALLGLV